MKIEVTVIEGIVLPLQEYKTHVRKAVRLIVEDGCREVKWVVENRLQQAVGFVYATKED